MFSAPNKDTACGMFTLPHIISLIFCIGLIALALYFSRKFSDEKIKRVTKILAFVFTIWEIAKIVFKFIIGDAQHLDHWIPLYFCSLFMFALWMCAYGRGRVYNLGSGFIVGGCIVGGFAFLVVPATSLMDFPVYHFLSIHSMLYHSSMVYLGILYIWKRKIVLNKCEFINYALFVGAFGVLSIILNLILDQNFMILTRPVNIPIEILNTLASKLPWLYTVCALLLYILLPFFANMGVQRLLKKIKK